MKPWCIGAAILILAGCSAKSAVRAQWDYRVLTSGERTSREYREEGLLLYRERLVPPAFSTILCPAGAFVYQRPHALLATASGWLRDGSRTDSLAVQPRGKVLTEAERARGWYEAAWDARRAGTPLDWVWVSFSSNGYWLKPQGLQYYSEILAPPKP